MQAAIARHLGVVLPLIEYDAVRLADEFDWLARFAERGAKLTSPYAAWTAANRVPAWHLIWAVAGVASALGRFEVLGMLWDARLPDGDEPLASLKMLGAHDLEQAMYFTVTGHRVLLDGLTHTARIMRGADVVSEHYPELIERDGDPLSSIIGHLQDAAYVFMALGARDEVPMPKYAYEEPRHVQLPGLINTDRRLRAGLSELFDADDDQVVDYVVGLASGRAASSSG